jgi:hypothetical protein
MPTTSTLARRRFRRHDRKNRQRFASRSARERKSARACGGPLKCARAGLPAAAGVKRAHGEVRFYRRRCHRSYDRRRGSYDRRRRTYDRRRETYDRRRGSYARRRGSYARRRGSYDRRRGSYDRCGGTYAPTHRAHGRRRGAEETERRPFSASASSLFRFAFAIGRGPQTPPCGPSRAGAADPAPSSPPA